MEFRQDIQILRGLAVLLVVFYHLQIPYFGNGYLGVDIFFVISGFLMAKLYDQGSILDFYRRRIDRLFPAYAVTIIVTMVAGAVLLVPSDFSQLFDQGLASVFFSGNVYFWSQNSYFSSTEFNPLLNLWSLGVEAQFYLIVPFLYPLLRRRLWLLALAAALCFAACLVLLHVSPKTAFFGTPVRVWEFLIGAAVAWSFDYTSHKARIMSAMRWLLPVALVGLMLVITLDPNSRDMLIGHPGWAAFAICALTGVILAAGMPKMFERSVFGKALSTLGDYSYSIYLVHFPLIIFMNYKPFGGTILGVGGAGHGAAFLIVLTALSYLSYQLIERKGRKLFNNNIARVTLVALMLVVSFVGLAGNKVRFTPEQQNIFAALEDRSAYRCGKVFRLLHPTADVCPIGQEGLEKNILLVGDSHADAIKTAFASAANGQDIGVYFYVSNDPLVDSTISPQKIIDDAKALGVSAIALHFNINQYKQEAFGLKLAEVAKLAKQNGVPVLLISPVPTYNKGIPQALYESGVQDLKQSYEEHRVKSIGYTHAVKELGVNIVDPAKVLCRGKVCALISEDGKPYYFDSHHLSLTGAELLEPTIADHINRLF